MTDTATKPNVYENWDYSRRALRRFKIMVAVVIVAILNLFFWHGVIGFAISFAVGLVSGWVYANGRRDKKRTLQALTPVEIPSPVNPALLDANKRPVFLPTWLTGTATDRCAKCGGEFLPEGPQPETTVCYWCWLLAVHIHGGKPKKSEVDAMWERLGYQNPEIARKRAEVDRWMYEAHVRSTRGRSRYSDRDFYDYETEWRRY